MTLESTGVRAVGYVRVSTMEQADSRAGLDAQEHALRNASQVRGWNLVSIKSDAGMSGKSMVRRPALHEALSMVEEGRADVLVVAKLDRLSRSVSDFAALLDRARAGGWGLVALDLGVDTTTPAGELVANVMAAVAQWERRAIGERTKEGLAARRAAGVRLGRPPVTDANVVARVERERRDGRTMRSIADGLTKDKVPCGRGGERWWPSSVSALLRSQHAQVTP